MPEPLSRRDLIARTVPALAAGSTLLAAAQAYGADAAPAEKAAMPKSVVLDLLRQAVEGDKYVLPKLPYSPDALEPHIDAQTMTLHHDKHHAAYVANLNKAIAGLAKLREGEEIVPATLAGLTRDISFNAGGHIFHTIFWGTMGVGSPFSDRMLAIYAAITKQYGSEKAFQAHFSAVALGVKGSGWAVAFYEPLADRILITDTGDQDNRIIPTATPILLLDVWEHAYYLKYQNKRADYIKAWWNVVNWGEVDALYNVARTMSGKTA
ncbi:MAG: superoxide dismutase [Phycisphaerales bacterium]|nr:superoxide dismutase [Phycisphaerales bacterium]